MSNQYPKTSQFESTSSILHLPANYEAALVEVTSESLVALGGLESWVADFEQSGMSLEGFTSQRSQLIGDTFSDTTRAVSGIINSAPGILDGLRDFSQTDRTLWANARADYTYNPAASLRLMRLRASSAVANGAMHVGVDEITFRKARADYTYNPAASLRLMRHLASSTVANGAMHVGVDDITFRKARADYTYNPAASLRLMRHLASSTVANGAMHVGVDDITFRKARADYTYNPAASLRLIRHLASSTNAGDKFEAEVRKNDATTNQQRGTGSSSQSGGQNRQQRDSRQDRQRQSASSSRENSRAPNAYDELMTTLRNAEDRGLLSTIRGFERTEVAKVIATVKHLRKNNPEITDKEIALKYARLSNNAERSSPTRQRATQIVMSLMGNKVSGKLPF